MTLDTPKMRHGLGYAPTPSIQPRSETNALCPCLCPTLTLLQIRHFPNETSRFYRLGAVLHVWSRTRYTLARPIFSRLAISVAPTPSFLSARASAAFARAVGARPLYFPSVFALAIPSRCLS